ncbi:ribosomal L7Ae/L30e/S12e/Gadd45 family protein [Peptostreptococcus anaerobius]|nr:ribosomal L7Ae/L30e/S12e/Gadd45 family protein [Peptostreptococcus anaerobius]
MNEKKLYSMIGLCMRSGNLVSGDDTTLNEVKKERVSLVIIAEDASKNTTKLFSDKCSFRNIAYIKLGTKDKLGLAIGKSPRAVLGIKNKNFADQILRLVEEV